MVIEDNFLNLQSTTTPLEDFKMQIKTATDGKEGISKGQATTYDLIFLDIKLPKHYGIYVNKTIRQRFPDAKIISLSSYDKTEILTEDKNVVFDDYLKSRLKKAI